jgi:hypothetical protein
MRVILFFAILFSLRADESFITKEEYARQLYHNPRGIGCHLCHGETGEGKRIADYEDRKGKHTFGGSAINTLDYATFAQALTTRISGMPRYFLTAAERRTLYFYLHQKESTK